MGGNTWTSSGVRRERIRRFGPLVVVAAALVVVFFAALAVMRPVPANPTRPVLLSSADWAPFVGRDLPDGGPLARLVTQVLQHQGYTPTIRFTSWTLAEQQAASGETVAVFPLVRSQARDEQFVRSDPLIEFTYVLFYDRRHHPTISSAHDLAGLRVGHIAGYDYWDALDRAVGGDYVEFETSMQAFQALATGKIDVLPEGLLSGRAVVADPDFGYDAADFDYVRGDEAALRSDQSLYLMMPKTPEGRRMIDSFNQGLAAVRHSEDYATIVGGLGTPAPDEVTLDPDGSGLVTLRDAEGRVKLRTPAGTRARVLAWPQPLTPDAAVKVKVLNGPATGRVGYVPADSVRM